MSSIFDNGGGSSILQQAVSAIKGFGASDSLMEQLYNTNPQVRQIVDQNRGQGIDNLLRQRGIDPDEARRLLGIR
jgi:hypothetical protein